MLFLSVRDAPGNGVMGDPRGLPDLADKSADNLAAVAGQAGSLEPLRHAMQTSRAEISRNPNEVVRRARETVEIGGCGQVFDLRDALPLAGEIVVEQARQCRVSDSRRERVEMG